MYFLLIFDKQLTPDICRVKGLIYLCIVFIIISKIVSLCYVLMGYVFCLKVFKGHLKYKISFKIDENLQNFTIMKKETN